MRTLLLLLLLVAVACSRGNDEPGLVTASESISLEDLMGPTQPESVVMVHGLGRTAASLLVLDLRLTAAGYHVVRVNYASNEAPLSAHVAQLASIVEDCCPGASRIHFVGHSLGGLVIRAFLDQAEDRQARLPPGRVVMLAPPNRGSPLADVLSETTWGTHYLGPTGARLGTDPDDLPSQLPVPNRETGIIAGTRSLNPVGSLLIPGPDDGTVALDATRLPGADLLIVPRSHTLIMNSRWVAQATDRYLQTGSFAPN